MESAVVDFNGRVQCHSHCVALSRVKCLEKLYMSLNEKKISVNEHVINEMSRLYTTQLLQTSPIFPRHFSSASLMISYHNTRSLHAHFLDMREDPNLTQSDIIIFSETRLCTKDTDDSIALPDYRLYRNDFEIQSTNRSHYGLAVYSKNLLILAYNNYKDSKNKI